MRKWEKAIFHGIIFAQKGNNNIPTIKNDMKPDQLVRIVENCMNMALGKFVTKAFFLWISIKYWIFFEL
jgi:hypothetical protein